MSSRPQSWVKNYEDVDFEVSLQNSGRSSPHERQHMLAESAAHTRRPSETDTSPVASSSNSRASYSRSLSNGSPPDAHEQPEQDTAQVAPSDPGPSFLRMPRSASFASSPLNPTPLIPPAHPNFASPFARPGSRGSAHITRIPSEESRALSMASPFSMSSTGSRGSMILYRRVEASEDVLLPPSMPYANRKSMVSISGDSFVSLSSDSKYPAGMMTPERGLVAYAYDPTVDDDSPVDEEDLLHDPSEKDVTLTGRSRSWRGFKNLAALGLMIAALLCLFVAYPIIDFFRGDRRSSLIVANTRINATGQADAVSFDPRSQIPFYSLLDMIDPVTPEGVKSRTGEDGEAYELVFSDEFEIDRRTFYNGDDEIWEAVDNEFYDPQQVTTSNGHLIIRVDASSLHKNGESLFVSGLLRPRNPFCLRHGFVEIGVVSPGQNTRRQIYWSGSWNSVDGDATIVPNGASLAQTSLLNMSIGIAVNDEGRSISAPRAPAVMLIDYIRLYKKASDVSNCDGLRPHQHVDAFLDFF